MATYDATVYWALFAVGIVIFVIAAVITALVARYKPCCYTKTVADPESDSLISRGIQTDKLDSPEPPDSAIPEEDVVYVTKHQNNTFSIHDRKRSSVATVNAGRSSAQPPFFQNQIAPTYTYGPPPAGPPMQMFPPNMIAPAPGTTTLVPASGIYNQPQPIFAPTPGPQFVNSYPMY